MADPSAETLSEAIVVWTGYGVTGYPQRDERRVAEQFGVEVAVELVPLMAALEKGLLHVHRLQHSARTRRDGRPSGQ